MYYFLVEKTGQFIGPSRCYSGWGMPTVTSSLPNHQVGFYATEKEALAEYARWCTWTLTNLGRVAEFNLRLVKVTYIVKVEPA